jgi:hypothetical protein
MSYYQMVIEAIVRSARLACQRLQNFLAPRPQFERWLFHFA